MPLVFITYFHQRFVADVRIDDELILCTCLAAFFLTLFNRLQLETQEFTMFLAESGNSGFFCCLSLILTVP